MKLLYFLESLRCPFLDRMFSALTALGGETAFLVIALLLFWCVDKRLGYYILTTGFTGTVLNQFLKLCFRVPRPWVRDPGFTIVESARAGATGYSFPSGHTQNAVGTFGCLARTAKKPWLRVCFAALMVLIPLSRMYLGVHTPWDVGVAAVTALILVFALHPVIYGKNKRAFPIALGIMALLSVAFVAYVELFPFPSDVDPENLASGVKTAYTLLGALMGMILVYLADETRLHFPVSACWWAQILKLALGLALVVAVKALLKAPLLSLFRGHDLANAVRYFLVVVTAGILWPLTFPWFSRLGRTSGPK